MKIQKSLYERAVEPATGVVGAYKGGSQTVKLIIILFACLSVANVLELFILIFTTFKTKKGLYFWSLLISGFGVIAYAVAFSLKLLGVWEHQAAWTAIALLTVGWYAMVTGQAVVLWSRLHLVVSGERGRKILLYTKWMICANVLLLHLPTTVVTFGSNGSLARQQFIKAYNVIEKLQMTGFCIQEFVLSAVYIVETAGTLRTSLRPRTKIIMQQLIYINVLIIIMDVALLGIEYASLFLLETILKGFIYSIKLKLEFAILSRLVNAVGVGQNADDPNHSILTATSGGAPHGSGQGSEDISQLVDLSKASIDYKHAAGDSSRKRIQQCPTSFDPEIQQIERAYAENSRLQ